MDSNPLLYSKQLYLRENKITDLVIPDDVTSIGSYAFSGCSGLTKVIINSDAIISEANHLKLSMKYFFGEQVTEYVIGDDKAATYELVVKDRSGNIVCTLIFNAQGQLSQITLCDKDTFSLLVFSSRAFKKCP